MAVGANASSSVAITDKNIDFSGIVTDGVVTYGGSWKWKGITISTGSTIDDKDKETVDDSNVVSGDASAYDYLILEYSASTCAAKFIVQYNATGKYGQWGAEYNQDEAAISADPNGGLTAIKLNSEKKATINQVALQNQGTDGTTTITKMYWATEEEYETAKAADDAKEKSSILFEGNESIELAAGAYGWTQGSKGGAKRLDIDASKFNSLVFEIASATGKCKATAEDDSDSSNKLSADVEFAASTEPAVYVADISGFTKLSQYAWTNLNKPDTEEAKESDIVATTLVVTKVYLTSKKASEFTGISSISADDADVVKSEYFNVAGQKVSAAGKGLTLVKQTLSNGKTVSKKVVLK